MKNDIEPQPGTVSAKLKSLKTIFSWSCFIKKKKGNTKIRKVVGIIQYIFSLKIISQIIHRFNLIIHMNSNH